MFRDRGDKSQLWGKIIQLRQPFTFFLPFHSVVPVLTKVQRRMCIEENYKPDWYCKELEKNVSFWIHD